MIGFYNPHYRNHNDHLLLERCIQSIKKYLSRWTNNNS